MIEGIKLLPSIEKMDWLKDRLEEKEIREVCFREGNRPGLADYFMSITFSDGIITSFEIDAESLIASQKRESVLFDELMIGLDEKLWGDEEAANKPPWLKDKGIDLFVAEKDPDSDSSNKLMIKIIKSAHERGYSTTHGYGRPSLKSQLKYANKIGARYVVIISEGNNLELKDMVTGEQKKVTL